MPKTRGNGEGEIVHLGVNNWKCTITIGTKNGKRIRKSKQGFATKNEAVAWGYHEKEKANPQNCSLEYLWECFNNGSMQKLSKSQQDKLNRAWERMIDLHGKDITELRIKHLQEVIALLDTYYQKREVKVLLSHLYKIAIAEQYVQVNLSNYIELPKLVEKERQAFTLDEVACLWKHYNNGVHFIAYILLMIYTGMMPMELFALTPNMIDLENRTIFGCGAKTEKRKTTPIRIANDLVPVLEDLLSRDKILSQNKICPMDKCTFYDKYNACLDMLNDVRHLPPYCCRHTTATLLANNGTSPSILKEIMRHSNFQTTTRYIHYDDEPIRDALNTIKIDKN